MKQKSWLIGLVFAGTVLASACADDAVQSNPHYSTGGSATAQAGSPTGGDDDIGFGLGGGSDVIPSGGVPSTSDGGMPNVTTGGQPTDGGTPSSTGGAPTEPEPPYDCVLHPKTHLEIINACTDATRIEKHPVLPPIN